MGKFDWHLRRFQRYLPAYALSPLLPCGPCREGVSPHLRHRRVRQVGLMALFSLGTAVISGAPAAAAPTQSGPVDVLSAGSLQDLMQQQIGPAFTKATGYTLNDTSMGSDALASGIRGGTLQGDVFISASPAVNATLEGSVNGDWVSWFSRFATSPLVLGYNPSSAYAHELKTDAVVRRHFEARVPARSDRSGH